MRDGARRGPSTVKPLAPNQRIRRWHTYLVVWAVHRVLGLVFGALILLASLTGGLLVMHKEIERIVERERHVIAAPPASAPLPKLPMVRAVANEAPEGFRPMRLMLARGPHDTERLIFLGPDSRTRWTAILNPYTGDVIWRGADQSLFTSWLLGLHMHLRLGGWGYAITGLGGVGLVLLGVTGLIIYRDRLGALWRRPMRLGRGWRLALSDLHKWVGVVSIYFSIVLGLTGAIYAVKIAPGQIAAPKPAGAPYEVAQLAPIEPAIAAARARFPGAELLRVSFPTTPTGALSILVLERDAPVWRKFSRVDFDPHTGALRAVHDARDGTLSQKFNGMLAPLHFGFYGSPLVKWLYFIGGFAPALLAASGAGIWYVRTRKRATHPDCQRTPELAASR